jgi:hypothetical protein
MNGSETLSIPGTPRVRGSSASLPVKQIGASYVYWMLAHSYFLPGLYMQRYATQMGLSLMAGGRRNLPRHLRDRLLHGTLNSTRYLEFDFVWKSFPADALQLSYLDVFSPWQLPILLVHRKRLRHAAIIEPGGATTDSVAALVHAAGLDSACRVVSRAADSSFPSASFDVVTSIAGLAAQRDDRTALAQMWRLLRPGGSLLLTLPCARESRDWVLDSDRAAHAADGGLRERIYDSRMLSDRIIAIAGEPVASVVYGETRPAGSFTPPRSATDDAVAPSPREPLMVGRNWRCYPRIDDLPGAGVIALRFAKAASRADAVTADRRAV